MNQQIQELAKQARDWAEVSYKNQNDQFTSHWDTPIGYTPSQFFEQKFAELIIQKCIKTIEYRAPGQMGEVGKGWTNGYDDGLKTAAWLLKEHFGVE